VGKSWALLFAIMARICAAGPLLDQAPRPEQCVVSGTVIEEAVGTPIANARVTVSLADSVQRFTPPAASVSTNSDGRFSVAKLDAGRYRFTAIKDGFQPAFLLPGRSGSGDIVVNVSGDLCVPVRIEMRRLSVVSGRVVNEDDEPLANVSVGAKFTSYYMGKQIWSTAGGATTNDLGEFRIFNLPSRTYRLVASPPRSSTPIERLGYVSTAYPSMPDVAAGAPVAVAPNQTISGLKITMKPRPIPEVRGRVLTPAPLDKPAVLNLFDADMTTHVTTQTKPDGSFALNVPAGQYRLKATALVAGEVLGGAADVIVGSDDIGNIRIDAPANAKIAGQIRWEGDAPKGFSFSTLTIRLASIDSDRSGIVTAGIPNARVVSDGTFVLSAVSHDKYRLIIEGLPADCYVRSISMASRDLLLSPLDVSGGKQEPIEIVISAKSGTVGGTVRDEKDQPVPGASVVLIPEFEGRGGRFEFHRVATTDQNGQFAMTGLSPGEYTAYAWYEIESGEWVAQPAVLASAAANAHHVTLRENSAEVVNLRAIRRQ
jgi:hypothetical protein